MQPSLVNGSFRRARFAVAGLRKPKVTKLGADLAGQVEAVGRNITQFRPGDMVFGIYKGAFAEYACAPESALVINSGLRDKGKIQPGQRVLIKGASGGVGKFGAFLASCAYLSAMLCGAAAGLCPVLLPSTNSRGESITIASAVAGPHTLRVGLAWWIFGIMLALLYFGIVYWLFRGKESHNTPIPMGIKRTFFSSYPVNSRVVGK